MNNLATQINLFIQYCQYQKNLNIKTLKAYRIDLNQLLTFSEQKSISLNRDTITDYIQILHAQYKPKTVKRKIACIRAFYNYLEFEDQIEINPIDKIQLKFREPLVLPKSLPLNTIQKLLRSAYNSLGQSKSNFQYNIGLRNIAVLELLFSTGLRVSELCSIKPNEIDLDDGFVKVHGKGARERIIFISNHETLSALRRYKKFYLSQIFLADYFFINRIGKKLSDQSVRNIINIYANDAKIPDHITPHILRHSFATLMLEEDVDIRYIQNILGHSSITTTQIYTHVSLNKQKRIMKEKHPRNKISI